MDSTQRQQRVVELIGQHFELLYRVSYRLTGSVADAEDLTQQTFLTAQLKLEQLRQTDNAKGWLLAILRSHFFRNRRRASRQPLSFEQVPEPDCSHAVTDQVDSEALQAAINDLPEDFRVPLVLFYFSELSYQEIATELSIPLGTVMSRLSRAKHQLRKRLLDREGLFIAVSRP